MTISEMVDKYGNAGEKREKKIGRFSATDLDKIINRHLTPKDFLDAPEMNEVGSRNCHRGDTVEYGARLLFERHNKEFDAQVKDVIEVDGIEYVAVADFIFKKDGFPYKVLECKSPEKFTGFKDYNKYQCELQSRIFRLPVNIGYFDFIRGDHGNVFTELGTFPYRPSDKLWQLIQDKCKEFNKKLIEYEKNRKEAGQGVVKEDKKERPGLQKVQKE